MVSVFSVVSCNSNSVDENNMFSSGLLAVMDAYNKWGFVNTKGEFVIEMEYNSPATFSPDGLVILAIETTTYVINNEGETLLESETGVVFKNVEGNYVSFINITTSTCGLMDLEGTIQLERNGQEMTYYNNKDFIIYKNDNHWGAINFEGEEVLEQKYDLIFSVNYDETYHK